MLRHRLLLPLLLAPTAAANSAALFGWLDAHGARFGPVELRSSCCGDGIGGFLTERVDTGDLLFAVPSSAFLTPGTALAHPRIGAALQRLGDRTRAGGCDVALLAGLLVDSTARVPART